jgi:hypothetical protein
MTILRSVMIALVVVFAVPALADAVRHETVRFAAGTSGSTINPGSRATMPSSTRWALTLVRR